MFAVSRNTAVFEVLLLVSIVLSMLASTAAVQSHRTSLRMSDISNSLVIGPIRIILLAAEADTKARRSITKIYRPSSW